MFDWTSGHSTAPRKSPPRDGLKTVAEVTPFFFLRGKGLISERTFQGVDFSFVALERRWYIAVDSAMARRILHGSGTATSENGGGTRAIPGPYRVVIVDGPEIASVLRRLLEMLGQQVETANTGQGGIELVMETQPDVVFARIKLPDMDGFEFAGDSQRVCEEAGAHRAYGLP